MREALMLDAHVVVRRSNWTLDVQMAVGAGEVVALLGPNGAGKSTTIRALAGLVPLSDGHARVNGSTLEDPAAGVRLPPEHRPLGVVFQDYLLFPHLSVLDNVAFGPRSRGKRRSAARSTAAGWLERVGMTAYAGRRAGRLSGGEAQRVALARALATDPRLLLLDEPLAALDAGTRVTVRSELRRHLADAGRATLVVTHDVLDAMVLADRLLVVEHGRVVQDGEPAHVARHPRTPYVARLVGLNLLRGQGADHVVALEGGGQVHVGEGVAGDVLVAFSPRAVALHRDRPEHGSPRNVWAVQVATVEPQGDSVRLGLTGPVSVLADVTPAAVAELGLVPGVAVWATLKASETTVYPG